MVQSDREIVLLELGGLVQNLYFTAELEAETLDRDRYDEGMTDAYKTMYHLIQKISGLDYSEFERKIDELKVAEILRLKKKPDGKYKIVYVEGRITTLDKEK